MKKYSYLRTCACVNSRVKEAALSYQHISLYRKRAKSNLGLIRTHLSAIGLFGASSSEWLRSVIFKVGITRFHQGFWQQNHIHFLQKT